jgi:uncharacterized protein involved in exopolysaccharide biosynthesis
MNNLRSSVSDSMPPSQGRDIISASAAKSNESATLPLIHMLRLCWVKRRMFFLILGTGTLFSVIYSLILPTMYTSATTIMPPNDASLSSALMSSLSGSGVTSSEASAGSLLLGLQTPGAGFVGILESRTVKESLVNRFELSRYYKERLLEDTCKALAADTNILENSKSGMITITVRSKSPVLASRIAQGYVDELDRLVALDSTSEARRERIFLEGRLKEIKQDLDDSAKALSQFSTINRTIDVSSQGKAMIDASLKMQAELVAARSDVAGLRQKYSEDNVIVRTANARVEELQRQVSMINGQSEEGDSKAGKNKSVFPSISDLPSLGLAYSDLARRVSTDEAVWQALTKQYEAAKVQEAREIPTVRVLDVANVPQRKTSPIRRTIVISGEMLSLLLACISVRLTYYWETMDVVDERKKIVIDAIGVTRKYRERFRDLPVISRVYTLFNRSERAS